MKDSIFEILSAYASSARFRPLIQGTVVELPTGERVRASLESLERAVRPVGLRLSKHAFVCRYRVGSGVAWGYGEAETVILAIQKCLAEGFERAVMKSLKGTPFQSLTSNGWAAHLSLAAAKESAAGELFERDCVLTHWLTQTPMQEVSISGAPKWLRNWATHELPQTERFKTLRVLIDTLGNLPVATTALVDDQGFGVLSHATARTPERAAYKALIETCRLAQMVTASLHAYDRQSLATPGDHALYYAHQETLPDWLFGEVRSWKDAEREWLKRTKDFSSRNSVQFEFQQIASAPLVVGVCKSEQIQGLYFGRTEDALAKGILNLNRLSAVKGSKTINLMPHCVA